MKILAVNGNNDLYLAPDGNLALKTGLPALMQACEHTMQSILGEMIHHAGRGLPYREAVWESGDLRLFEDSARGHLSSLEGVEAVTEFACETDADTFRYWASIRSVFGEFEISGTGASNA